MPEVAYILAYLILFALVIFEKVLVCVSEKVPILVQFVPSADTCSTLQGCG